MKITISAELTDEQVSIIAWAKGYSPIIDWEANPQTPAEFTRLIYDGMIKGDATSLFIAYKRKQKEADRIAEEQAIQDQVSSSITSTIE